LALKKEQAQVFRAELAVVVALMVLAAVRLVAVQLAL
jgi:hypothetical protein